MKTQIEIPKGWAQVSKLPISQEEKTRIYRAINDGMIPSLKLSGGKFAPIFAPELLATDFLSGKSVPDSRAEKVAKVLEQIASGVSENSKISAILEMPSGSVSNYVRTLTAERKVVIEGQRYYLAGKEPSLTSKTVNGPYQMSQDLGGLSLSLTNLESAIDALSEDNSTLLNEMLVAQKETNRLLGELLKVWHNG